MNRASQADLVALREKLQAAAMAAIELSCQPAVDFTMKEDRDHYRAALDLLLREVSGSVGRLEFWTKSEDEIAADRAARMKNAVKS